MKYVENEKLLRNNIPLSVALEVDSINNYTLGTPPNQQGTHSTPMIQKKSRELEVSMLWNIIRIQYIIISR